MKKPLFVALFTFSVGCTPMGNLRPGEGTVFQITGKDYDEIWEVATTVVDKNLFMMAKDKSMGTIKAESRVGVITGGDIISLYITPARSGKARYTIEVTRLQQAETPINAMYWENEIMAEIKFELD